MINHNLPGYRALFWVSMALTAASTAGLQRAGRPGGVPGLYDPHALSKLRGENYPFTVEVNGYTYRGKTGDFIDDHILAYGAYEKDVLYFLRDYVTARRNPDAVFLDVGACEGQHSLFMSRLVKKVHAFEPYPPAAERFKALVRLNKFENIRVHEVGLGANEGSVPFYAPPDQNIGSGTFLESHKQGDETPVGRFRVVTGDAWLGALKLGSVDVVKIDVEGFEGPVLEGLTKTLARFRPLLVIEVTGPPKGTIGSVDELRRLLPAGYEFLRFEDNRECALTGNYRLLTVDRLAREGEYEMVVAYPRERGEFVRRSRESVSQDSPP